MLILNTHILACVTMGLCLFVSPAVSYGIAVEDCSQEALLTFFPNLWLKNR